MLNAVDAMSAQDVWAAGHVRRPAGSPTTTVLLLHYDGTAWSVVPTGNSAPNSPASLLNDVDMVSSSDGWAVGSSQPAGAPAQALIMRRQAGKWLRVPTPPTVAPGSELTAVHAVSAQDAWAVGWQLLANGLRAPLVLHWDGTAWLSESAPEPATNRAITLIGVAAAAASEVWAVGADCPKGSDPSTCRPLALRRTGTVWHPVPTAGGGTALTDVIVLSPTDVWVVGYDGINPGDETEHVEHWDGHEFVSDDGTAPESAAAVLGEPASALSAAVATPDTQAIWAVGWSVDPANGVGHVVHRG